MIHEFCVLKIWIVHMVVDNSNVWSSIYTSEKNIQIGGKI